LRRSGGNGGDAGDACCGGEVGCQRRAGCTGCSGRSCRSRRDSNTGHAVQIGEITFRRSERRGAPAAWGTADGDGVGGGGREAVAWIAVQRSCFDAPSTCGSGGGSVERIKRRSPASQGEDKLRRPCDIEERRLAGLDIRRAGRDARE